MWDRIVSLFSLLWSFWEKLDESTKKAIIEVIVKAFEPVFRKQYKDSRDPEFKV